MLGPNKSYPCLTRTVSLYNKYKLILSLQQRTTMILLCEDGSLRIYMANTENTSYWLSPYLQPQSPIAVLKPAKKKKVTRSGHTTGSVSFPVDFFEHCYQTNDVEFGGNDLLQLYNTQQIKHRLTAIGMYVASTKVSSLSDNKHLIHLCHFQHVKQSNSCLYYNH